MKKLQSFGATENLRIDNSLAPAGEVGCTCDSLFFGGVGGGSSFKGSPYTLFGKRRTLLRVLRMRQPEIIFFLFCGCLLPGRSETGNE